MTLKTILKNFLNYADTLEAQKKLGKDIYEVDFQKLKALTEQLKHDKDYSTSEGLKEVNRRKNRYKDILPYDYTRVILSEYPGVPGSDYINANYIKGASGSLAYIASQGPLPNTVVDFWRMIWECEIQVIVMACNEQESGKYKCECYWPTDEEKKQYGNINVEFVKWRQVCPDFLVRTLKACWESEERVICQFHYTTWPDHGVPNSVQPILELVRLIRDCQASEAVPVLIHCSAGCGRTGTICAIDYVWGLMRMGKLTKNFNLFNVIADMRRQRIAMVQTKEQYVLVHKAVSSLFEQQLRVIDSHTYENLDEDGEPLILKELHQQEEDIYEDILEPPFLDEPFISFEKLGERKIQPSNTFHEYASGNKDVPPIPSKRDPFPENLLNFSKSIVYKGDESLSESRNHSYLHHRENTELEQSIKEADSEYDIPYSRNSQILMKLCREESVKRLISGWNKAVEQPEDKKDVNLESEYLNKSSNIKTISEPNQISYDPKCSSILNQDGTSNIKNEKATSNSIHKSDSVPHDRKSSDAFSKSSSPEDTHAGKLVGKATVIRRPSIAKLKALFEKTSQNNPDSSESGRRRTLFRSQSHYVSHTSRAFSVSDGTTHPSSNDETKSSVTKTVENKSERNRVNSKINVDSSHLHSLEDTNNSLSSYNSQQVITNSNIHSFHIPDDSRKMTLRSSHPSSTEFRDNSPPVNNMDLTANHSGASETYFNSDNLNTSTNTKIKQNISTSFKKDRPPELPMKKKPAVPVPQPVNTTEKNSNKDLEITVPRFIVNLPKESIYSEPSSHKVVANVSKNEISSNKNSNQTEKSCKEVNLANSSVASPDWNSDDSVREYVKRAQDVERRVLSKNQSFSDPEQSSRCLDQTAKQVAKPKLSLTDQTYPKLTYSAEKGLEEKVSFTHECAYMNINSLAQKNIRQIEEKLKTHPRGAIIDLTSRKSYIDEMAQAAERQYVFRNTVEPVKFLPRQESKDLISQEKHSSKTEHSSKESLIKSHSNVPNSKQSSKTEDSKNDPNLINSKNLLLHSPPPKSKRGHLSKSNSKPLPATPQDSSESDKSKQSASSGDKNKASKSVTSPPNYSSANVSQNSNSTASSSTPAADRSDPRYFPVNRQTASDARYESEKHKAESREAASGRPTSTYEPLYSTKPINTVYHKLPLSYEKSNTEANVLKDAKYVHDSSKGHYEKENLYGLQRSTSGPQILPPSSDANQKASHSADINRSYNIYGQIGEDNKISKSFHSSESRTIPHYDTNQSYSIYEVPGQHNVFPPGPPKPPRTYHYDMKSNQESTPDSYSSDHNVKRDGGRYIVSVASPKHSNAQNSHPSASNDYRYDRASDMGHVANKSVYQPQPTYVSPIANEVHMSRSYPFSNYDRSYYPRPYGKQYYPESIQFRNVQPVHVTNNIYAVTEKPVYAHQNIYGTVKHRSTFSDYENVYDAQIDYMHAMSNSNPNSEHKNVYQSVNPNSIPGLQYSQSDASVYAVLQTQNPHNQFAKSSQANMERDFKNLGEGSVPKRVYFDTLQRRNKQVTWEQRRSHDDMDIRPAPSARLREQIHARRSMVELDNLEISVASEEGYPENSIADTLVSPLGSHSKVSTAKNERLCDTSQSKSSGESSDSSKECHKKSSVHAKEPASFGETLSKAFGKLTSFTKFNAKEGQSGSAGSSDSSNTGSKAGKQKDKDKHHNFTLQSPSSKESPSEQWTQV